MSTTARSPGVNAIVMPDGTVLDRTELFTADELSATFPLRTSLTPAARPREAPEITLFALAVGIIVAAGYGGRGIARATRS